MRDYYEILDGVLEIIYKNKDKTTDTMEMYNDVSLVMIFRNYGLSDDERGAIMDKLISDGFIVTLHHGRTAYRMTLEGFLFYQKGMYRQKNLREQFKYGASILQNIALAGGTLIAGIYALFQIIEKITCHC